MLDTSSLPEDRRCLESVAADVAAAVWRSTLALVVVVLAMCPWRTVVYLPYEELPERRRFVLHPNNVTLLKAVTDSTRAKNFHEKKWRISIFPRYCLLPYTEVLDVNPDRSFSAATPRWSGMRPPAGFSTTPASTPG